MSQTPTELLAPYKAAMVAAARDYLRAAGREGSVIEIPATVPPCVIVLGAQENIGALLRTTSREPMVGGRRAGDPPSDELNWEEPASASDAAAAVRALMGEMTTFSGRLVNGDHLARRANEVLALQEKAAQEGGVAAEPLVHELGAALQENARLGEAVQELRRLVADVQRRAGAPDGWKLVPLEPSIDQLRVDLDFHASGCQRGAIYRAMVEAAPAPTAAAPESDS